MSAFDFLHWCFSSFGHGFWTVVVGSLVVQGAAAIIRAARGDPE